MTDDAKWIEPVEEVAPAEVRLVGGPYDGTGYEVGPMFAVTLPDRLEFFGSEEDAAGWHGYEKIPSREWETAATYNFTGFRKMAMFNVHLHRFSDRVRAG